MALTQQLQAFWQQKDAAHRDFWRQRLVQWRQEPVTLRIEHPTRLDRARAIGYKAKQGVLIVRQRVPKGGHTREKPSGGRRSKNTRRTRALRKNYQLIAEERAIKKFPNCEVLNSYYVANDGKNTWFEVVMIDPNHPAVIADKELNWIANQRRRVHRGLTSAGRKMRGLRYKGKGVEKARPSRRANRRRL